MVRRVKSLSWATTREKSWMLWRISSTVLESNACPTRLVREAMSLAIRPACAVSWPMSGSVAPGQTGPGLVASASISRMLGSSCGSSREFTVSAHSPKSDALAAMAAGFLGSATPS